MKERNIYNSQPHLSNQGVDGNKVDKEIKVFSYQFEALITSCSDCSIDLDWRILRFLITKNALIKLIISFLLLIVNSWRERIALLNKESSCAEMITNLFRR